MKHTKVEAKANTQNLMQDTVDEDSSSESGNLGTLFLQDLSENTQIELNGGENFADPVDDDGKGDGGGRTGGDWIVNHNETLVNSTR